MTFIDTIDTLLDILRLPNRNNPDLPITNRAKQVGRIHVLASHSVEQVVHTLDVPHGACPVSGNPLSGTVTITYLPIEYVAEVVSLRQLIQEAFLASMSVEECATWLSRELATSLGTVVTVRLELVVRPGRQRLEVTVTSRRPVSLRR